MIRKVAYSFAIGVLFGLAQYTGSATVYWMLVLLLLMAAISGLGLLWFWWGFSFQQKLLPATASKGDQVTLKITFRNPTLLPIPRLQAVVDTLESAVTGQHVTLRLSLPSFGRAEVQLPMEANLRGLYEVGVGSVRVYDMLGLFSVNIKMTGRFTRRPLHMAIYPKAHNWQGVDLPSADYQDRAEEHLLQPDEASIAMDTRVWRVGDNVKRVHWKLTARKRELIVKLFEQNTRADVCVLLDDGVATDEPMAAAEQADRACDAAISLLYTALRRGLTARLICLRGERMPLCRGDRDLEAVLQSLCVLPFDAPYTARQLLGAQALGQGQEETFFFITARADAEVFDTILALRERGAIVRLLAVGVDENDEQLQKLRDQGIPCAAVGRDLTQVALS